MKELNNKKKYFSCEIHIKKGVIIEKFIKRIKTKMSKLEAPPASQTSHVQSSSKSPNPSPDPDIDDASSKRQATRLVNERSTRRFNLITFL